jgi:hypothetical protein
VHCSKPWYSRCALADSMSNRRTLTAPERRTIVVSVGSTFALVTLRLSTTMSAL